MMGICGDDCACCPRYIATKDGGEAALEAVRDLWVRLGLRDADFSAAELACHGCAPGNRCAYEELRACVREKEVENCGRCESYPCDRINQAFETTEKLRSHAERVCTPAEMAMLAKAFLSKKAYFDRIHLKRRQEASGK